MKRKLPERIFFLVLVLFLPLSLFSENIDVCRSNESQSQCEERLQREIAKREAEIKKLEENIRNEKGNQKTLASEIQRLRSEIRNTEGIIHKKNILISRIQREIKERELSLKELNEKLRREKESLAKILRRRYEIEETTLLEFLLSKKTISDFFVDLSDFYYIQSSLSQSFQYIDNLKRDIYGEKKDLEQKKQEEADEKYALSLEKGKIESKKKERDLALQVSKSKEATLAALKKKREAEIRKIRAKLIQFRGRGVSRSISFGEAYDYAKFAEDKTGVRAALIMAIMQQESGFGNNVGGCYVRDEATGAGVYKKTGNRAPKTMKPSHIPIFKNLTKSLGMNWRTTPVSCAYVKKDGSIYGWGGAMGYTQFIPGTWSLVKNRVENYLHTAVADPWNPRDAVMATAVYLRDLGAQKKTYTAERNAACRYYGSCSFYDYGTKVMQRAVNIQKTIDFLEKE